MRAIVAVIALGLAASPVAAEPATAEPARAQPAKKKPAAAAKKKAPAAKPSPGVSLGSMAKAAAGTDAEPAATPNGARRLDLSPSRLFGKGDPSGKKNEKTSGIGLGDDRNWKVQAVQVGAMAAGFAALVALCGDGKCLLPFGGSDASDRLGPSPDLQISPANEPRPAR